MKAGVADVTFIPICTSTERRHGDVDGDLFILSGAQRKPTQPPDHGLGYLSFLVHMNIIRSRTMAMSRLAVSLENVGSHMLQPSRFWWNEETGRARLYSVYPEGSNAS